MTAPMLVLSLHACATAPPLLTRRHPGGVLEVRLNRPSKLNALSSEMVDGLREAVVAAREEGASGLLLTASGDRAFCAGGDIRQVAAMPPQQRRDFLRREYSLMIELFALRDSVPVVALADGLIFGAGAGLFMAAETRIASAPSSLAMPGKPLTAAQHRHSAQSPVTSNIAALCSSPRGRSLQ